MEKVSKRSKSKCVWIVVAIMWQAERETKKNGGEELSLVRSGVVALSS